MRDQVKTFTQAEIITRLKKDADQWLVAEINGHTWFSDGRMVVRCDGQKLDDTHVWFTNAGAWKRALVKLIERIPDGYTQAIEGCLFGAFTYGYSRLYTAPDFETHVYLNEMYVRAVWRSRLQAVAWVKPKEPYQCAVFVDDGEIVASIMPLRDIIQDGLLLKGLPEIPFLEDAALYFRRDE